MGGKVGNDWKLQNIIFWKKPQKAEPSSVIWGVLTDAISDSIKCNMWTPGSNKEDWLCCLLSSIHADCSLTQKAWASRALWVFRIGDATLFLTYEIPYIWCQIFLIGTGWSSCSSVTPPAAYKPTTHGSDDCQACWKVITRWMQRACHDTHSVWTSRQANEDSASPPKENAISERGAALDSAWRGN